MVKQRSGRTGGEGIRETERSSTRRNTRDSYNVSRVSRFPIAARDGEGKGEGNLVTPRIFS